MTQQRPLLMVSTCGTSLLTSEARKKGSDVSELIQTSANSRQQDLTPEQRQEIDALILACRAQLLSSDATQIRRKSAELNGLLGYYNNQLHGRGQDQHILLHTDTYQGAEVAKIIEAYLKSRGLNVSTQTFPDLRADTVQNFQRGLCEVIKWCEGTLPEYRKHQYHIAFNLTGGFKSIQGWMQTLGMFHADEIVYIFESGVELLRIRASRWPSTMVPERRSNSIWISFAGLRPPARHAMRAIGRVYPKLFSTSWTMRPNYRPGENSSGNAAAGGSTPPSFTTAPSGQIRLADKLKKAASELASDRLIQLNERLDDLARYQWDETNLSRLDFKPLKGNPRPPSTHECDAWADQAAWRMFAHFEGRILILDDLVPGLH